MLYRGDRSRRRAAFSPRFEGQAFLLVEASKSNLVIEPRESIGQRRLAAVTLIVIFECLRGSLHGPSRE